MGVAEVENRDRIQHRNILGDRDGGIVDAGDSELHDITGRGDNRRRSVGDVIRLCCEPPCRLRIAAGDSIHLQGDAGIVRAIDVSPKSERVADAHIGACIRAAA